VQGSYASSSTYAAKCAVPRTGVDPSTGRPYVDTQGSITEENFWLRSWTRELYLWYREVLDRNPAAYNTTASYFETQKTTAITSSGKPKDQFHFTYPTPEWIALSQSGVSAGYGVEWAFISNTPPRILRAAYAEPGSPASNAGISRGIRVLAIDGVSIDTTTSSGIATLNAGLSPTMNETHSFLIQELNGAQRTVSMTAAAVTTVPVQNVRTIATATGNVGYMQFNSHLATSELQLINAFTQLQQANVTDLVLDLRYNGGGYLVIASQVGYMIAGSGITTGRVFERTRFNDQYSASINPVTGGANTPIPFVNTSVGLSATAGLPLPTLNLSRVFVITGSDTCSASESIINGLRGIGLTVIQIGNTTCGKPYGFYAQDNCGTTYFSVQLQGVNAAGFGDYADGFTPAFNSNGIGVQVPGCTVADDLDHALGDLAERRLAAAMFYRQNGYCSPALSMADAGPPQSKIEPTGEPVLLPHKPWRDNRILGLPGNR
jgi:C-terminal processing protease CtpA/Prc